MTPELLVNAAWGAALWAIAAAAAVLAMRRCPAVMRRGVCRLALAASPLVMAVAASVHWFDPSSGLLLREAGPAAPREAAAAMPGVARAEPDAVEGGWAEARRPAVADEVPLGSPAALEPAPETTWVPAQRPQDPAPAETPTPRHPREAAAPERSDAPAAALRVDWRRLVPLFVVSITCSWMLVLAGRLLRQALWRRTWRAAPPAWQSLTRRLARRLGMTRPFAVFVAPGLRQPAAGGIVRGAIILPDRSPRSLGPDLRGTLAHELGHLDGRDPLWCLIGQAAVALLWWCPVVWWLERRARIESELTADDHALACGVRPIDLAKTLARFAEWDLGTTPAGVSGMACHLKRRIEMIMNGKHPHRSRSSRLSYWLVAMSACLAGLAIAWTPLVGIARAADGKDELARPPVVRVAEGGEGDKAAEPRRDGDRERGEGDKAAEPRRDGDREGGEGDAPRERPREGDRQRREGDAPRERPREGDRVRREGDAPREGRREGEGEGRARLPRELVEMAKAVKMTNEQEQAVKKQLQAKEETLRAWRRDNAARLREAEEAMRRAQETLRKLRAEQDEVAHAADEKVMGVFTPQQRASWETIKIARMYDRRHAENPIVLTNRQLDDIDILCEKAVKELVAAESKPKAEAAKAKHEILFDLQKKIYDEVLDAEQRARSPRPRGYERKEGERRREGEVRREGDKPVLPRRREGEVRGEGDREGGERERPVREGGEG